MPVTILTSHQEPRVVPNGPGFGSSHNWHNPIRANEILQHAEPKHDLPRFPVDSAPGSTTTPKRLPIEVLQWSHGSGEDTLRGVVPVKNGFVDAVVDAYNQHHRLVLRPDDVWIAILSQFSIYVNNNAEKLRNHFVSHAGQQALQVVMDGDRHTVDYAGFAQQMTGKIQGMVVDPELREWIVPDFSTTTHNDKTVASVMMMATLRKYFTYSLHTMCGIPSVTLEGEKTDWENLLQRIDKFREFGKEPKAWAQLLRPILTRFAKAFDDTEPDTTFWGKVCHHFDLGSGATYLSGWITAFCVWDDKGKWNGSRPLPRGHFGQKPPPALVLDSVTYPTLESDDIPTGSSEVDVIVKEGSATFDCKMIAGHLVYQVVGEGSDTVKPVPLWVMTVKPPPAHLPEAEAQTQDRDHPKSIAVESASPPGQRIHKKTFDWRTLFKRG